MSLVPLPQLADPDSYDPNTLTSTYIARADLEGAGQPPFPALEDWMKIFYDSIESFARTAAASVEDDGDAKAEAFAASYRAALDAAVAAGERLNCLHLCHLREVALRKAGFDDAFQHIKQQENDNALEVLPSVLAEIDDEASNSAARWEMVIRGVCAANIFDLGCAATTKMYHDTGDGADNDHATECAPAKQTVKKTLQRSNSVVTFHHTRERLQQRPWAVDDLDALVARLSTGPAYKKALLFVDNSGADVVLGMLPLARELLQAGTQVVIAANELPSINDITARELDAMLPAIAAADDTFCSAISSGALTVVTSGNDLPVIDLRRVSDEVVDAAGDADLVVLEGMGRAIETNLQAVLSCDALKIGMIKHPEVAAALEGRMYDCVVKFDQV